MPLDGLGWLLTRSGSTPICSQWTLPVHTHTGTLSSRRLLCGAVGPTLIRADGSSAGIGGGLEGA